MMKEFNQINREPRGMDNMEAALSLSIIDLSAPPFSLQIADAPRLAANL